jgi:hypothetical protein
MKERKVATRTEQIIIDSRYKNSGTHNNYVIDFKGMNTDGNTYSNVFFSNFDQVVGIKVVGAFIKGTVDGTAAVTDSTAVDFVCPQIPRPAQQLGAAHGYVWCRVPLIRNYGGADNNNLQDQWWEAPRTTTRFFQPTQLTELSISLYNNLQPSTLYDSSQPDGHPNYLILEVTSLDREQV